MPDCLASWSPFVLGAFLTAGTPSALPCPEVLSAPAMADSYLALGLEQERPRRLGGLVQRAQRLVGLASLRRVAPHFTDDCSGLVRYLFEHEGVELIQARGWAGGSAVDAIYRSAHLLGALRFSRPEPGDLVFFRDTYDRNRDGRRNDGLTHIGLVDSVDARSGTLTFIHRTNHGVARERMNLAHPDEHEASDDKAVLNDYVRGLGRPVLAPRLSGELFAGFASGRVLIARAGTGTVVSASVSASGSASGSRAR